MRRKIQDHPKYPAALNWIKLISVTGFSQVIVQGLGLLSGILVIRLLPTNEYAFYTLANTMLGTMTILADGGISTGVMSQGGKVWQDKEKLGVILATGLDLRKKFAIGTLLVAVPILIYLLMHHGANWLMTLLIIASLIPAFFAALSDSLLEIVPKLHQEIILLQRNQINVSIYRLFLTALTLFFFPWTFIAILANGIPRIYGNIRLREIASTFATETRPPDADVRNNILKVVKKIMPGAIYFCFSGQITIWLISVFGNTESVAQLGALGRLSMMLNIFSVIVATLIIPRFARLNDEAPVLLKRFLQIQGGMILLMVGVALLVKTFPTQTLWFLGKNYAGLENELIVSILGSCILLLASISYGLFTSRGWVINPAISIVVQLASIVIGILLCNVSSLLGVLLLNVFTASIAYFLNSFYCLFKINREIK